jgi:hypothetical protein
LVDIFSANKIKKGGTFPKGSGLNSSWVEKKAEFDVETLISKNLAISKTAAKKFRRQYLALSHTQQQ